MSTMHPGVRILLHSSYHFYAQMIRAGAGGREILYIVDNHMSCARRWLNR